MVRRSLTGRKPKCDASTTRRRNRSAAAGNADGDEIIRDRVGLPIAAGHHDACTTDAWCGLRTDRKNAHVQPTGAYRYHGIAESFINRLGEAPDGATGMIAGGFAADEFPVYLRYGYRDANDKYGVQSFNLLCPAFANSLGPLSEGGQSFAFMQATSRGSDRLGHLMSPLAASSCLRRPRRCRRGPRLNPVPDPQRAYARHQRVDGGHARQAPVTCSLQ